MSPLRDLQLRFQAYLTDGARDIEQDIVSTDDALAEHRLGAYYNAYRIRLIDALAIDYSALEKYLGRESFENLALDYLQRYPSVTPSIRWFGRYIPEYLDRFYDGEEAGLVRELARYEWAQASVFDAADDAAPVRLDDMAQFSAEDWPGLRFEFIAAMRWLDLHYNAPQIESALDSGKPPPATQASEVAQRWLLWRREFRIHWRSLEVHEAWAMEQAAGGACFAEICEGLLEWIDAEQVALVAAGFLKQWISDQLLTRIEIDQALIHPPPIVLP